MQWPQFCILTKASWRNLAIKGGMFIFIHFACILYGTWLFLKSGFYILIFREQYLGCFSFVYAEIRVCCSWDNKLSQLCHLFFDQMPGSCSYFTCKVRFQNSISRLRVIAMGDVLVYRYTHLTSTSRSLVRVRVSPTIFFFTFFSFWPFTVPSPLIIKTRRFANNVINNPFHFIITLFSLDPLLLACNPYGRWLFLKSGFYIPVFYEQYRRYFCLDFVDFWVCCRWD